MYCVICGCLYDEINSRNINSQWRSKTDVSQRETEEKR